MDREPERVRGHIAWAGIEARLRATRSMILATTRPDGRPALPTWFWWNDGRLYFITARGTQKARNLGAQPAIVAHSVTETTSCSSMAWRGR